jgi:hypothetical protein
MTLTASHHRFLLLMLAALALCSCEPGPKHKPHAKAKSKPVISAESYVQNLSLARLNVTDDADDGAVSANLDTIQGYGAQKKPKRERVTLVVLDYKKDGASKMQQVIAPVNLASGNSNFPAALEIMNRLNDSSYQLHDLDVVATSITPDPALKLPESGAAEIRENLSARQAAMLEHAQPLNPLANARAQLQLIRFFKDHNFRDAAYLSVDNVKKILAGMSGKADEQTVKELSQQLESLEGELHKTMPLGFFK